MFQRLFPPDMKPTFTTRSFPAAVLVWPTWNRWLLLVLLGLATGCNKPHSPPATLSALMALDAADLTGLDLGRMNLLCAEGLPGVPPAALADGLGTLDAMAARVRAETERHRGRFRARPEEFEHSEGFFRLLMLAVVLAEDFGVAYHPGLRLAPGTAGWRDGFHREPRHVLLPGLLAAEGAAPGRAGAPRWGACSSLPVLQVAVGRRLGYPLRLVATRGHLFVRWDGAGERFNVDAAGEGLNRLDDAHYRAWPSPVTAEEEAAEGWLRSMTPAEELAACLSIRALCLVEAGRLPEAAEAAAAAVRHAPDWAGYR